ncbi:MAG: CotH kinase family protein [Bacteroidales bacterium]|nr:CotH kinase family protein [Bacteroidales bacterium]
MRKVLRRLIFLGLALCFCACETIEIINTPEKDTSDDKYGFGRVYGSGEVPEIHITVPLDQWNTLLANFDQNNKTKQYVSCNVKYTDSNGSVSVKGAGLRLRGNTSRRRPEDGETHSAKGTSWHHCHFSVNLDKYTKDAAHKIRGMKKMHLKWFKDDPCYVREVYCYDLFRRFGIWTAPHSTYCRLWLKVEGDPKETYFGVYELLEPIDTRFVKARTDGGFGKDDGNLWKCRWPSSLNSTRASFGRDDGSDAEYTYEFKSDDNDYAAAKDQLQDFILKLTGKSDESFYMWIQEVCNVGFLLQTYAVNVAVGMWDDYWNNSNNYYLYFDSTDKYNYHVYFIPFDYDNTLGTSQGMDAGRQDPLNWGNNSNPLIYRLLKFEDFRQIYKDALLKLVGENEGLFYYTASIQRIKDWQDRIREYVPNDTGEDCEIYDAPAPWGNKPDYKIMTAGEKNFFQVRTQVINNTCK